MEGATGETANNFKPKRKGRKVIVIILAVLICIALLVGVGVLVAKQMELTRKVEQFQELLETQQYASALEYYEEYKSEPDFTEKADKDVIERYEKASDNKDEELEVALFNSGILPQDYVAELEKTIKTEIDGKKERYLEEGGTFKDFKNEVKKYLKYNNKTITDLTDAANKEMSTLIQSRAAYQRAEESKGKKEYYDALVNYSKVAETDSKYSDAQSKMEEITPLYKEEVMGKIEKIIKDKDYDQAVKELETLKKYCADSDVESRLKEIKEQKAAYDEEQKQIKMQQFKDSQEVEVISAEAINEGYYLRIMKAQIVLKNNSDKVAKDVSVSILCYDDNGYPVRVGYSFLGDHENLAYANYTTCNIQPGGTYGSEWVVDIPDQCRKVKACVKSVTYVNGLVWQNPYYDYWLEENHAAY